MNACRRAFACAACLMALCASGCSKPTPPDEATLRAEDRRELGHIVSLDVRASRVMRDADDAAHAGDAGAAVELLASRARPAIDDAIRAAEAAALKTPWGKAKRDELLALLRARSDAMPKYEEAVKSGDPEKMLDSVQAQAAIERRALATVAAVEEGR